MTKRVQLVGHDAETANAFLGLEREVTVDTENWHLRLHDGETVGGWLILNRDENDNRYQARSVELDGLLGWEPNERGYTVRKGPSTYVLREFEVDEESLVVTNANGYDGNTTFALAPIVSSDHQWTGEHTFTQSLVGTGGFVGNLTGNTAGVHTGNVIGNVTGDLTGDANGNHTGTFTGAAILTDVELPDGAVDLDDLSDEVNNALNTISTFVGMITAYGGNLADLPSNWVVCDGTNGTPDLRERFIIGAGTTYTVGSTGGTATHSHAVTIDSGGAHAHTGSVDGHTLTVAELPAHKHANGVTDNVGTDVFSRGSVGAGSTTPNSIESNSADGTFEGYTSDVGSGNAHSHGLTIDSGGAHSHSGTAASTSNLPPYFSLVYVMRIS